MAPKLKDRFFQSPFLEAVAAGLARVDRAFDAAAFLRRVEGKGWGALELKERMHRVADALGASLPADYRQALRRVLAVEGAFGGFDHLAFADFVERFGVEDPEASLPALEQLTRRSSAEFAVRPFLERYPQEALARLRAWARSPDEHVRRLASEGSRPRLPWGRRLPALQRDPSPVLPILEALLDDPSEYVRRSVANHLGDIAKDHPALALELAERWLAASPARAPLLKHALRGPLKRGDRRALALFGFGASRVEVRAVSVAPRRVPLGGQARLTLALRAAGRRAETVRLEYELVYARPGGRTSRKVFRIAEARVEPGEELELARKLDFRDRTIRKHHRGPHALTLCVNGERVRSVTFALV